MGNLFPSVGVTRLLVECGARLNATNAQESTPLHTAACMANFKQEVRKIIKKEKRKIKKVLMIAGKGY